MRYKNIRAAQFVDRPNRFIAHALLNDTVIGKGEGTSKKAAQRNAALAALEAYQNNAGE